MQKPAKEVELQRQKEKEAQAKETNDQEAQH